MNIGQIWKVPAKPKGTEKPYAFKKIGVLKEDDEDKVYIQGGVITLSDRALGRFKRARTLDIYRDTHDEKNIALVRCPKGNFTIENNEVIAKGLLGDNSDWNDTYKFTCNWHGFFVYRKCE